MGAVILDIVASSLSLSTREAIKYILCPELTGVKRSALIYAVPSELLEMLQVVLNHES